MKGITIIIVTIAIAQLSYSQVNKKNTEKVLRLSIINPGIEYEFPIFNQSTLTTTLGVGFEGAYKNLSYNKTEPYYNYYMITPFFDVRYKNIYNQRRRISEGLNIRYNTGNYWGGRFLYRYKDLSSSSNRIDNMDFSVGPIWGFQRSYGKFYLQIDAGPMYYFDTKGNSGIFPLMLDINIGINLKKYQ